MLKSETRRIGAFDYTVTQLDAVRGRRALVRLAKVIAPAANAANVAENVQATGAAALGGVTDRLGEADIDYFCDLFAANTTVSGGEFGTKTPQLDSIFALHFAGLYKEMGQWLLFALEVNFGSFFKGIGGARKPEPGSASPSTSPSTSTGTSGV